MAYFNRLFANLEDAVKILRLDRAAIVSVAARRDATSFGVFFLVFPVVVNLLLSSFLFPSGFSDIFSKFLLWPLIIPVLSLVVMMFVIVLVAGRIFGSHVEYVEIFRVLSYGTVFMWLGILPFLLDVLGISLGYGIFNLLWFAGVVLILIVAFDFLMNNGGLGKGNATLCLLIGVISYFAVQLLLGALLVGPSYRVFY